MTRFPRNLKQAIGLLLAIVFVPLLAVIVVGFVSARSDSYHAAEERVLNLAQIAQLAEQRLIANARQTLFVLSHAPVVVHGDLNDCSATLRDVQQASIVFANIGAADSDGNVLCSAQIMSGAVNIADRLYFRRAMETLDLGIGEFQVGRITGKPSITFGYPVLNTRHNRAQRIVFAALDLVWLGTRLRQADLPGSATTWVLDDKGRVLASSHGDSWIGQVMAGTALGRQVMQAGEEPRVMRIVDIDGVDRLYAVAPLWPSDGAPQLRIAVGLPIDEVYAEVNRGFAVHLGLLLMGIAVLVLITLAMLRHSILRPIEVLVAGTRGLASGDLAIRVPQTTRIAEFAHLAGGFNDLASALEVRDRQITEHVDAVERMNRRYAVLSGTNQTIVHAADEASLYRTICDVIVRHGVGLAAWISVFEPGGDETVRGAATSTPGWSLVEGMTVVTDDERRRRLRGGRVLIADLGAPDHTGPLPLETEAMARGACHYVAYPIAHGGRAAACLNIYAGTDALWSDDAGLDLLKEMAGDIGFALDNFEKDTKILRLAYHDTLTGLPNLNQFEDEVDRAIARARPVGLLVPVIKFEVSSLNRRIDRYGRSAGDFVLRTFAAELEATMPPEAVVARVSDDHFAVMLPPHEVPNDLRSYIEGLIARLPERLRYGAQDIALELNAGVASFPEDGENAAALMRACFLALDTLSRSRKGAIAFHSARLSVVAHERWQIERHLAEAVSEGEFFLDYQPTTKLAGSVFTGVEALVRWRSPALGLVSPGKFIPIAEQTGQIIDIGYWVFEQTCRQMEHWFADLSRPDYASVNVSPLQLYAPDFVERIAALLDRYPAARDHIAIEITETAVVDDFEFTRAILRRLKALGLAIFVDDFGTGYSSLSYLRQLPVDTLKIDITFTSELTTSSDTLSVVKAIIALARSLGLATIAEGIESAEQAKILTEIGCDVGQGYLYSRPVGPDAIAAIYRGRDAPAKSPST